MTWGWPQYLEAALLCMGLGRSLALHGQPKTGKESFSVTLAATAVAVWILWKGGFWG